MYKKINIRLATLDDMKNVFDLSNDATVRQNSIHTEKIEWKDHIKWFKQRISKKDEPFYIAEDEQKNMIGQVRIDKNNEEYIVSISIKEEYRGHGYGQIIISEAVKKSKLNNVTAYIYENNKSSIKAFEKAGFENTGLLKFIFKSSKVTIKSAHIIAMFASGKSLIIFNV